MDLGKTTRSRRQARSRGGHPMRSMRCSSDALAAGGSVFELARIMGTSVRMIERHFGALLEGAGAGIASRLDALDAKRERAADV